MGATSETGSESTLGNTSNEERSLDTSADSTTSEGWVDTTWSNDDSAFKIKSISKSWSLTTWSDDDGTFWGSVNTGAMFPASLSGGHKESSSESFHCEL